MKNVLIFGASGYGKRILYSLDERYIKVVAFVDNHQAKHGHMVNDVPIIPPEKIQYYQYDSIIVSVGTLEKDIKNQLMNLGVEEERIITFHPDDRNIQWLENRYVMARACIEEINKRQIPGNIAELGVYKGEFASYLNRFFPDKNLYLFDTFEGFDQRDEHHKDEYVSSSPMFTDTNVELVLNRMQFPEKVTVKKGYFPDTAVGLEDTFCFVSLDADLYKPILQGLEYFYPRLVSGGYIFIHDYDKVNWPGATLAVREFSEKYNVPYLPILDRGSSVVIAK
ncbi:TylF/MycF/NovP-related O-methyltransferase [Paenibacillus sp. Y5S-9]|uniref:TylF/MycF/NovP-related O-methyltransferase n=1 Tax=Paenibacillus sp. Y5S-9 TaxID=3122489 RepID=UPI0030CD59AE